MKPISKLGLVLAFLLIVPTAALAGQWDRFDRFEQLDGARLRDEIRREVGDAVRRAQVDASRARREAIREVHRTIREARREARAQASRARREAMREWRRWRD
jgi:hypothetical protein